MPKVTRNPSKHENGNSMATVSNKTRLRALGTEIPRHLRILPSQHERGGAKLVMCLLEVEQKSILDERNG